MAKIAELQELATTLGEKNGDLERDIKIALHEIDRQRIEHQQKLDAIKGLI